MYHLGRLALLGVLCAGALAADIDSSSLRSDIIARGPPVSIPKAGSPAPKTGSDPVESTPEDPSESSPDSSGDGTNSPHIGQPESPDNSPDDNTPEHIGEEDPEHPDGDNNNNNSSSSTTTMGTDQTGPTVEWHNSHASATSSPNGTMTMPTASATTTQSVPPTSHADRLNRPEWVAMAALGAMAVAVL